MIRRLIICGFLLGLAGNGCSEEELPPVAKKPERKSNIVKIQKAVPYGKHVACENIFDVPAFAEATGLDVGSMKDNSKSNSEATSVCGFFRAGEPPKTDAQLKEFKKNSRKLGVLPGDEMCTVSLTCHLATDPEQLKERCAKDRETAVGMTELVDNEDLGQYSCVRKTDRPPSDYAYTYRTIDAETKCLVEVMGGPSVVNQELVSSCTKASLEQLTMDKLKNFQ